jgi:dihydrofolate reductase
VFSKEEVRDGRPIRCDQPDEKGTVTMKLTATTFVSVDGVMQGISGRDEDRSGGFDRGGWTTPLWDNEARTYVSEVYQRADAFLFGRRTYEIFAGSWGAVADPAINPIAKALNTRPKYVASTTLTDPGWAGTTVLSGDVAAAVGELKAKPEGELQVHGSGALIRWLLDNDLVDEMNLLTFPAVVGRGMRLFPDTGQDTALELVESRATPNGVLIQVYRPAGRLQYGEERRPT